ncbi:putative transcriptional regulator, TetR family protein [Nocardioides szechwanensis]|uniref:Transcriptional regulator, TetR family n=1 Tax=Nocardioides szechwanensis TaxID=1005944 RepID=A0A1H0F9P6_9ACTN|nr:TetR family transcriptional regulator [Nocardioides szechwanensis]GEP36212.1 putative transcriptional regulator, TetR family protein [Nocardioides szechwanensis]SDN91330.1 transcriptional regulator, TetR family [Nocardioides szechwanensis]
METTPQRLIEAATQGFAEHGISTASLVEITRQAGQRNRGAVHYHFGGREGLLVAVLAQHAGFLGQRERELLAIAQQRPDDDLASVVEAIVRPTVELVEQSTSGSNYLVILAELFERDPSSYSPEIEAVLARTGGYEVYALLRERMPAMDDELRAERFALMTFFVLGSVARRVRTAGSDGRAQLGTACFVDNLVAMASAMLTAPTVRA